MKQYFSEFSLSAANYKADQDYNARNDDELSFRKNDSVVVKQKHMDGWWLAEYVVSSMIMIINISKFAVFGSLSCPNLHCC